MVNRTKTVDLRTPFSSACGVDNNHGLYYQKIQSGGDFTGPRPRRKPGQPRRRFRITEAHAYSMTTTTFRNLPLQWGFPGGPPSFTGTGPSCFGGIPIPPNPYTANDDLDLINKLYQEIVGSDFNLAVTLGQTSETLETIGSGAIRIGRALRAAKRLDFFGVGKALGLNSKTLRPNRNVGYTATSLWLEYRYGWEPLLNDVYDAAQLLGTQLGSPQTKRYSVRNKRTGNGTLNTGLVKFGKNVRVVRKQIVALISEQPSALELTGLTSPSQVAWELVPFSFVVDWFLPIGNYLQARGAASVLKGTFITSTLDTLEQRSYLSGSYIVSGGESYYYLQANMSRSVSSTLNVPMPTFQPLSKALSWKRAVSGLALLNNIRF